MNRPDIRAVRILPRGVREKFVARFVPRRTSEGVVRARLDRTPAVMDLAANDISHRMIYWCGFYERRLTELIEQLRDTGGGLLIDVGANYGYYSILWCANRPDNKAISFEASPIVFPHLNHNVNINGLENVETHNVAVSYAEGMMSFDVGESNAETGWGGLTFTDDEAHSSVSCITLDRFIDCSKRITALKVDVEGADTWVLEGATHLLESHRVEHVFFEENAVRRERLGIGADAALSLLKRAGYKVERISSMEFHAFL